MCDVSNLSCLALSWVHYYQLFVRILGNISEYSRSLWHLMALYAVPAPGDKHLCFTFIGNGQDMSTTEHTSVDPPCATKFLSGGRIEPENRAPL